MSDSNRLIVAGTENWQNSGSLSKRFWTRIKLEDRLDSSSCIAVMINKNNLRVYLEWHNYKGKDSSNTLEDHNNWINHLHDWIRLQNIKKSQYSIWTSEQEDNDDYITLENFLNNQETQITMTKFLKQSATDWIRVGLLYSKEQIAELDPAEEILKGISELKWLYEKTDRRNFKRYWLYNTYYSQNTSVWKESQKNSYAAMQYEKGKENQASITRNVSLAKQISKGDIVVAYTGEKGFLGYGEVIRNFYNEENPSKYLSVNGGAWKQRIGVSWSFSLEQPVRYKENDFLLSLGIQNKAALSSNTILEIPEKGFNFVENLMLGNKIKDYQNGYINLSQEEIVSHIHNYISMKGFFYRIEEIKNLFLSLRTKPFVIISGTGKTKIVELFAESLGATDDNGRYKLIPVRPDWSDGSDLLGYVDIKGDFQPGPLTKIIQNASNDKDNPYFVVLDEMNLARVEYYFSDFLSVMESRKWEEGEIVTTAILPEEQLQDRLNIPPNLYIIGTVNMDETTHPFSKKVLDRANTIEFNEVKLDHFLFPDSNDEAQPKLLNNERIQSQFLYLKDAYSKHKSIIHDVTERLIEINELLSPIQAHIGYRVRDEICFYLIYSRYLMKFDKAFDYQLHQKILPRITASETQAFEVLKGLYQFCTSHQFEEIEPDNQAEVIKNAKYPKSAKKIHEMLGRGQSDGFTSFWIG
ncbi:hypothetical protein CFK37_19705 [Virgibacillus phasianinus]|uniref:ATPase dynein-related AAA domain-containing protein n=1 Tax=Virgibacillus phasianinus TaxID=2017483 RepID=A0A220U8M4_9BACI|nr:hypothetical protein CFK37_19705 [Virgibacillus phasianinus]